MSHDPDDMSLCLSGVLCDIGLNKDMIIKTRRAGLLRESLTTIGLRLSGRKETNYIFESVTEATTTPGLDSDKDYLICRDNWTAVTELKDCKPRKVNYLITEGVSTPPGYCLLDLVLVDESSQIADRYPCHHLTQETLPWQPKDYYEHKLHGPSIMVKGRPGYNDQDYVFAYHCKIWPSSARVWLKEEGIGRWPTKEMKSFAENNGCFLVHVGSKGSEMEKYEYRVSTSLAERYLMFSLNITQIRCYVLLKMIIKTFINSCDDGVISSYMCKTILFHCIKHTYSSLWQESKLLCCLTLCLSSLQYSVLIRNLPHFIIHDNNIMAGRITTEFTSVFIEQVRGIILNSYSSLFDIKYAALGVRLQMKVFPLNTLSLLSDLKQWPYVSDLLLSAEKYNAYRSGILLRDTGKCIQDFHLKIIFAVKYKNVNDALRFIRRCISELVIFHRIGSSHERMACKCLAAVLSSTLGSLIASCSISSSSSVSSESLRWFDASLDSDVSSCRLKMASAFYCAGDMDTTCSILEDIQKRYDLNVVEPVCPCTLLPSHHARYGFNTAAQLHSEEGFKHVAAFCVKFLRCEMPCVPKELQLEMYRTTKTEQSLRHGNNKWFDLAIIDSLTYLLFLKYKTCGRLGKHEEQKQALKDLRRTACMEPNLGHRETALNLVGQIMVEEGKLTTALKYFMTSLSVQPEHNAAKIHICIVLAKMINRKLQ